MVVVRSNDRWPRQVGFDMYVQQQQPAPGQQLIRSDKDCMIIEMEHLNGAAPCETFHGIIIELHRFTLTMQKTENMGINEYT